MAKKKNSQFLPGLLEDIMSLLTPEEQEIAFELFSDGTSVTSAGYQEKWISENGRLKIGDDVWSYTLSDNKLTLTAKNGSVGIYERVQQ